jgi:hypothetical protein
MIQACSSTDIASAVSTKWQVRCLGLLLLGAGSIGHLPAQTPPSKEYIRLGSRVIAIEAPPVLTPAGEQNASAEGETNTPVKINGSPNSPWTATVTGPLVITTSPVSGTTDATGASSFTYSLPHPNLGSTTLTGTIQIQMESGTAIYNISQPTGGSISVSLATNTATATSALTTGSVGLTTVPPTGQAWTTSIASCSMSVNPSSGTTTSTPTTLNYTVPANTGTGQRTCAFTVSATGSSSTATFTVTQSGLAGISPSSASLPSTGGSGTINVQNWTGWSASVSPSTASWLSISTTATSVSYQATANSTNSQQTAQINFSGGTPAGSTAAFTVTEAAPSACSATIIPSTLSFPVSGGSGQTDPKDYSVLVSTTPSNVPWTASCSAGGEGFQFYLLNGGTETSKTNCGGTINGSGNQTIGVDLTNTFSTTPLTATITVTPTQSCGTPPSINVTQASATFTVAAAGGASPVLYQNTQNAPIQFVAYLGGVPLPDAFSHSATWTLQTTGVGSIVAGGSTGGLYTPIASIPTNVTSVVITATLNTGGTASITIPVVPNVALPQPLTLIPSAGSGSGTQFTFPFNNSASPQDPGIIESAKLLFSTSTTSANATNGCEISLNPANGSSYWFLTLTGGGQGTIQLNGVNSDPGTINVYNNQCSLALAQQGMVTSGNQTSAIIQPQFYDSFAGTIGVWVENLNNDLAGGYAFDVLVGTYNVSAPGETVSPSAATLYFGAQTQQFTAYASTNPIPDVTWTNPSTGSISTSGLYTAPASLTSPQTVTIQGKRTSDNSAICCATLTLNPVSVNPASSTLFAGQTEQFSLAGGGSSPPTVTWSMTPSVGTLTAAGLYTAPASISANQTITITATNTANSAETVSGTLALIPVGVSALSPATVSLQINQTQTFTTTVTGTSNQTLNWTLSPSGATSGSVSSAGVYTAPSTIPTSQTVTITATSAADSTKSSSAQITLIPDTLTISPTGATLTAGQSQQFTATVTGTSNAFVNWTMNPSVGTLSSGGYYTAPGTITSSQTVVITATSQADPALTKSVNVIEGPSVSTTVTTSPSGLAITVDGANYAAPQTFQWVAGTSHTIAVASPIAGTTGTQYVFSNWSDSGALSHSITIASAATTYTASFTTQYQLTTTASPSAGGGVSPASEWVTAGTVVPVSATANSGYQFTGFSGNLTGTTTPQNLTMSGPENVTANFVAQVSATVTTSPSGLAITVDGTNYTAPHTFQWLGGTNHTIAVASPIAGTTGTQYVFANWSDSGAQSHSITVPNTATTYTASFTTQYQLTTAASPSADGSIAPASGWVNAGTVVPVSATANSGFLFTGFSGALTATTTPQNLTVNAPSSVTANFAAQESITVTTSPSGLAITVDGANYTAPQTFQWAAGSSHTLAVASPLAGATGTQYVFGSWSDSGAQSHSVTVPSSATTYTVTFTTQYQLTTAASPSAGGTISPATGWYNAGTVVPVSATANSTYNFTGFSGGLSGTTTPQNLTMSAAQTVTANFVVAGVSTTVTTSPSGLTITVDGTNYTAPQTFQWVAGSSHTLAVASQGAPGTEWTFASWSDGGAQSHSITVPTTATTYTASFNTSYYLTTGVNPSAGGSVSPAPGWYPAGQPLTITATPSSGYGFAYWGESESGTTNPLTVNLNGPLGVVAYFGQLVTVSVQTNPGSVGLNFSVDGGNYITPATLQLAVGSTHTLAVSSTEGASNGALYNFVGWSDGGAASHTVTIPAGGATYLANFAEEYTATFVKYDTTTQGNWHGVYGSNGYAVAGDQTLSPSYVSLASISSISDDVWSSSSPLAVALEKPSNLSQRIAAAWYASSGTLIIDLNITDGNTHQLAIYCLNESGKSITEDLDITDPTGNIVLSPHAQTFPGTNNGEYLVWNVSGHVQLRAIVTSGSVPLVSAIFFDP